MERTTTPERACRNAGFGPDDTLDENTQPAEAPRRARTPAALLGAYLRSRYGGAMFITGTFALVVMTVAGTLMVHYAWREAELAEIRLAARAAVAAAGMGLMDLDPDAVEAHKERIAAFVSGLVAGLFTEAGDIDITYDGTTTGVVIGGLLDADGDPEPVEAVVNVRLGTDVHEVALALDISGSMGQKMSDGVRKIDALRDAVLAVEAIMDEKAMDTPGALMISVVPFAYGVNVADTCDADPVTGQCRGWRTPGKERYLRLLEGTIPGEAVADVIARGRARRDNEAGGHWVDMYFQYGAGLDMGVLRHQYLPDGVLDGLDWDLRRENVPLDVSTLVPPLGVWEVNDEDFWNGCVMARWGAFWHDSVRPPGWDPADPGYFPVAAKVDAWYHGGPGLPPDTPLHLGDAPPDPNDPHSLFTAFSYPDARIAGTADHTLESAAWALTNSLDASQYDEYDKTYPARNPAMLDNHWGKRGLRGRVTCPDMAIIPLTDDLTVVRDAAARLDVFPTWSSLPTYTGERHVRRHHGAPRRGLGPAHAVAAVARRVGRPGRADERPPGGTLRVGGRESRLHPGADQDHPARHRRRSGYGQHRDVEAAQQTVLGHRRRSGGMALPYLRWTRGERHSTRQADNVYWDTLYVDGGTYNNYFEPPHTDVDLSQNSYSGGVLVHSGFNQVALERIAESLIFSSRERTSNRLPDTPAQLDATTAALHTLARCGPVRCRYPNPTTFFRRLDPRYVDGLMAVAGDLGLDGRPTQPFHFCRPQSHFTTYGRLADVVYVGEPANPNKLPYDPVEGAAPFDISHLLPPEAPPQGAAWHLDLDDLRQTMHGLFQDWLLSACATAGQRGVDVKVIFFGTKGKAANTAYIALLEQCVDSAGGSPLLADVLVAPTRTELIAAFESVVVTPTFQFVN